MLQCPDHGDAGNGRIDGEEDIVEDNESEEWARLCDPPRLVSVLAVVPIEVGDCNRIDRGDRQRDFVGERVLEGFLRNVERVRERRLARAWVRDRRRRRVGRELED